MTRYRRLAHGLLLAAAFLWTQHACAARLTGKVVGISDGDTLTVLDASRRPHRVRLIGIDAPEKAQSYSQQAKKHLSDLAYGKQATVEWHKMDRYGRLLGKVSVGGMDVCLDQVLKGYAWHYKQYAREQPAADRRVYARAQAAARAARLGLWRASHPQPPWEFRRRHARGHFLRGHAQAGSAPG